MLEAKGAHYQPPTHNPYSVRYAALQNQREIENLCLSTPLCGGQGLC